ncbi:hypothetical protein [Nostoc sp. MS1]|uniref:hypothetical protein n=1 Tax=Nostoc sp. MS1 TaxID=2764711 RepID=UPI001CC789E9|nr:hypothetical protein [Nostoc sp. MS1]BCL38349.1 hypothetical protein NSMS1_47960 [Nostoc sp. MS1]
MNDFIQSASNQIFSVMDENIEQCVEKINNWGEGYSIKQDDEGYYFWTYGCITSFDEDTQEIYETPEACITGLCIWLANKLKEVDTFVLAAIERNKKN